MLIAGWAPQTGRPSGARRRKLVCLNESSPIPLKGRWTSGCLILHKGAFPMGTVGLSFGSPTSGAGFNVSSTVSSIVANLQKVETPWKTQLTTLQSQDTALSSIGTLLSNLSNDLTSLTDFSGVLAQKTGASSNTSVLELTAASTSAVAGTH